MIKVYWGYIKIALAVFASGLLWYFIAQAYNYITEPRKELVKRDKVVLEKTIESKYINKRISKDKVNTERKLNEVHIIDGNISITNWLW